MKRNCRLAVEVVRTGLARCRAVAAGVNALHGDAAILELAHLVFHERDERADDERRAPARDARQLVAERLPRPGGHDEKHVTALDHGFTDRLLVCTEGRKAERLME